MATLLTLANQTITAPQTVSPTFTYSAKYTTLLASFVLAVADAHDTSLTMTLNVQVSHDGGASWITISEVTWKGALNLVGVEGGATVTNTGPSISVTNGAGQLIGDKGRVVGTVSRTVTGVTITVTGL